MTTFGYIHHDDFDDEVEYTGRISLVVIRNLRIVCGPVFVPNFRKHKARLPKIFINSPEVEKPRKSSNKFSRFVIIYDAQMPAGYTLLKGGDQFIVLDPDGIPIGVFKEKDDAILAAGSHYNSGVAP